MSARPHRRRSSGLTVRVAAVLVLAVVAAACTREKALDVPAGFVAAKVDGVARFAHPAGWQVVAPGQEPNSPKLQVESPERREGLPVTGIQVFHTRLQRKLDLEPWVALQMADFRGNLRGYDLVAQRDIEVEGAAGAKLVEATYEAAGSGVALRTYQLLALDDERNAVTFVVAGTDVDRDLALRIIDTFELDT